jgi:hypothetical protein
MRDMGRCLKSKGTLLTTPNFEYRPMGGEEGPFLQVEDRGHVRKGYTQEDLKPLTVAAVLSVIQIGYCSGFISQNITALIRVAARDHPCIGWFLILPLSVLPILLDPLTSKISECPGYSITLIATKGLY